MDMIRTISRTLFPHRSSRSGLMLFPWTCPLLLAMLFIFFVVESPAYTKCPSLEFTGNWPFGPSLALTIDAERSLAFMSGGGAVYILDISDPEQPTEIETFRTRGQSSDHGTRNLFYSNGKLYIANGRAGLLIWDVNAPSFPVELDTCYITGQAKGVYVFGSYAYVAAGSTGLQIVDISNPTSAYVVGSLDTPGNAVGIVVQYPYAYVADGAGGLHIINVSSPSLPFIISTVPAVSFTRNVSVDNNHAYLADDTGGLIILDVSNPYNPVSKGIYPSNENKTYDVSVQGTRAYVVDFKLFILDVSNPSAPQLLSQLTLPGWGSWPGWGFNVQASGSHVYVAGDMGGMSITDVSDPKHPLALGQFLTPGWSWDVDIQGNYAYMAEDLSGLYVVDISDPANPVEVVRHNSPDWTMGVEVRGNYAYLAARTAGLRILDISSPATPIEVGYAVTEAAWYGLAVKGSYAYGTDSKETFYVVDISEPTSPMVVGSYDLNKTKNNKSQNIAIEEPYAYVAHGEHGVRILDVSLPWYPIEVGVLDTPARDVWVQNGIAYVAASDGFHIVNVSTPWNPVELAFMDTGSVISVFLKDSLAFLGLRNGLSVVNVSNPANPILADHYQSLSYWGHPDYLWAEEAVGDYVYVAQGIVGLQIYKVDPLTCHFYPVPRTAHKFVIDGICDPFREWVDAFSLDISISEKPVMLYLAVDTSGDALYVGLDDHNNEKLDRRVDISTIFFDEDNNNACPLRAGQEGGFLMFMNRSGPVTAYQPMTMPSFLEPLFILMLMECRVSVPIKSSSLEKDILTMNRAFREGGLGPGTGERNLLGIQVMMSDSDTSGRMQAESQSMTKNRPYGKRKCRPRKREWNPPGVQGMMSDASGHVQAEWRIDLAESALNAGLQKTIGLYITVTDRGIVTGKFPSDGRREDPSTFNDVWLGCLDRDKDGAMDVFCGGDDCDDGNPRVNPETEESQAAGNCNDGVDNDCDGLADRDDTDCSPFRG